MTSAALHHGDRGDFSANVRLLWISAIAIVIGALCSLVAVALLCLISLFTNLFYFQRLRFPAARPADNHLGWLAIPIPIIGG
jgi:hypothetical protein